MKLLYITQIDMYNNIGYKRKIINQLEALNKNVSRSYIISLYGDEVIFGEYFKNNIEIIKRLALKITNKYIRGYLKNKLIFSLAEKCFREHNFNYVYIRRFIPITYILIDFLKKIKKNNCIVFYEYPTFPWKKEMLKNANKIGFCMDVFNYNSLLKVVDYIPVIKEKNYKFNSLEEKKFIEIGNGININDFKVKNNSYDNDFKMVSVANVSKWHGYDRILKGLYNYYKKINSIKVIYYCIGDGPELKKLKKLSKELNIEEYVKFFGGKYGNELDEIFDCSHIAFGSIANHRKGLLSDEALKNREYCARGIPFVIASDDLDFKSDFKYVFRIPKNETSVNIYDLLDFYNNIQNDNYSLIMRDYARKYLSWEIKMNTVVQILNG